MGLEFGTKRVGLAWVELLKGWRAAYLSRASDGHRKAYGRGPTCAAAEKEAERNWLRQFGERPKLKIKLRRSGSRTFREWDRTEIM